MTWNGFGFTLIGISVMCSISDSVKMDNKLNVLKRLIPYMRKTFFFLKAFRGQQNIQFGSGCFQGSSKSEETVSITPDLYL